MGILHQVRVKAAMKLLSTFLTLAIFPKGSTATPPSEREGRLGLFSIVTFPNSECQSTKDKENKGICYSSTECSGKGGLAQGNCAAGFGVCCIIKIDSTTGGTISHNATIIQNNKYPSVYATPTVATTIKYTLKPMKDICFMRFDFINFDFALDVTTKTTFGACHDKFSVDIPTTVGTDPPAICGKNNGYHMYVDNMKSTADIKLDVLVSTNAWATRVWKIKVSQIGCDCPTKPPMGCQQYYLESTGTIESFNYQATSTHKVLPLHSSQADWNICIRKNKGMCGTTYAAATAATSSEDTFQVNSTGGSTASTVAESGSTCAAVRLAFDGVGNLAQSQLCGAHLSAISGIAHDGAVATTGFKIRHQTINTATTGGNGLPSGYKLSYYQTGC